MLLLEDAERSERLAGSEIVIYVQSVRTLYEEFTQSGAEIVRELGERPWGTLDFTVRDPDGYELIFTEAPAEWTDG